MAIPRKPKRQTKPVDNFIKAGPAQSTVNINGAKKGRRVISLSLMLSDSEWVDKSLLEINSCFERKITRSEIISTAISVLKKKTIKDITQLLKNR